MQTLGSPLQSANMPDGRSSSLPTNNLENHDPVSAVTRDVKRLSMGDSTLPTKETTPPIYGPMDSSSFSPFVTPDPQPHTSIRKKGPSKSFSGFRSGQPSRNKPNPGKLWHSFKAALHCSHKQRSQQPSHAGSAQNFQPNPFKRRSSVLPTLQRPWTSGSPFGPLGVQDQASAPPLPTRDTPRSFERPPPILDYSRGAAARQFARDYGKTLPIDPQGSALTENWALPRARESGISMGAPFDGPLDQDEEEHDDASLRDPISFLPAELSSLILSSLPADTLRSAEAVSHKWRKIAADPHLWRMLFHRDYGIAPARPAGPWSMGGLGIGKLNQPEQPWKRMYAARKVLEKRWEAGNATMIRLNGHTDSVYCVQFDEEKIITGSRDRTIRVWDVRTGALLRVIGVHTAFETDRRELVARPFPAQDAHAQLLRVLNPYPVEPSATIYHVPRYYHKASILCLQYDDTICVTGSSDCTLIVWRLADWQPLHQLSRHKMGVLDVVFDADKIVSCSKDSTICVWDRRTGELLTQLHGHRGPVNAVQLRGDLVVSASGEGCAKLWSLAVAGAGTPAAAAHARHVKDFWSQDRGLACVEFSDDRRHVLAGGNDQVIYKFCAETGELRDTLRGHSSLVRSLYLDAWNNRVVSGSYDFSLRVWDFERGRTTWRLERWATSWTLSAKSDFRRIVCTNQDGRAMIVDFGCGVKGIDLLESA